MSIRKDIIEDIESFKDRYKRELEELKNDARAKIIQTFTGISSTAMERASKTENVIFLDKIGGLEQKSEEIRSLKIDLENEFTDLMNNKRAELDEKMIQNKRGDWLELIGTLDSIKEFYIKKRHEIYGICEYIFKDIQDCPYAQQENKTKNALLFQNKVIELLSWSFIDDLKLSDEIKLEGGLETDAVFEVIGEDIKSRFGVDFDHVFVECKNYEKPDYRDLMQLFACTLYCEVTDISKIPLGTIISRKNPKPGDITWEIRRTVFLKKMEHYESRLILFVDVSDLEEIVNCLERGDPAVIIRSKIEELRRYFLGMRRKL